MINRLKCLASITAFLCLAAVDVWLHIRPVELTLRVAQFKQLPGWEKQSMQQSLIAFQSSCTALLNYDPDHSVGSQRISLQAKDWFPACRAAQSIKTVSKQEAKSFFETWFVPVEFYEHKPVQGLFTGYYMPKFQGSTKKTKQYATPLYSLPKQLITADLELFNKELKHKRITGRVERQRLIPFYSREEISRGALKGKVPVLYWIESPIDRLFLEIEGSGAIELNDGRIEYVGYAGSNGRAYQSIASVLIKQGIMTHNEASSARIKQYLNEHPNKMHEVLNQNPSFVFFRKLKGNAAFGAQGVPLTPGYSLAVDHQWIPYSVPIWLDTETYNTKSNKKLPFNRLVIAQDTGGAIKGIVRGDVFWGAGKKAEFYANHMQEKGRYWLLLPRHAVQRITSKPSALAQIFVQTPQ